MTGFTPNFDSALILHQDDDLIVFNKPAKLLSVADGYDLDSPHLRSVLEPHLGKLWIVHRLDKETSGVILIARNAETHRQLNEDFRNHTVEKTYHGLVTPLPVWNEFVIDLPLNPNADRKHRTRVDLQSGKEAYTSCKVIKRFTLGALLEIQIKTGVTHQIRAHLRAYDLILFGESLYNTGVTTHPLHVDRTMLHARKISFQHPIQKTFLTFTAPYPDDFRDAYTKLRFTTEMDAAL